MLFEFLEDAGLASTLDALEKETGCVSSSAMSATPTPRDLRASVTDSSAAVAEDETPRFRRRRRLFADPSRFPSTFPAPPRARRRGGSAATLCDALAHLRRLVLDGRWAAAEAFAAPEDHASSHPSVDHDAVRARLRTQAFLELMDDQSAVPAAAPDPDALVKALGHIREVCGARTQRMRTRMRTPSATRPGRSDIRTKKRRLCVFSHIHSRPRSATRAPCSRWATSARTRRCAPGPERAEGSRRSRRSRADSRRRIPKRRRG